MEFIFKLSVAEFWQPFYESSHVDHGAEKLKSVHVLYKKLLLSTCPCINFRSVSDINLLTCQTLNSDAFSSDSYNLCIIFNLTLSFIQCINGKTGACIWVFDGWSCSHGCNRAVSLHIQIEGIITKSRFCAEFYTDS